MDKRLPGDKPGGKAYRAGLRARLIDLGFADTGLAARVAADLMQACGMRPRRAWRLAREMSLTATAARFNEIQGLPGAPMRASRIWEFEQWPDRGARPTLATLAILAEALGTTWDQLVDVTDLAVMAGPDRAAFHAAAASQAAIPVPGSTARATPARVTPARVTPARATTAPGSPAHGRAGAPGITGPGTAPAPSPAASRPALRQLPADVADFTGRAAESQRIARLLAGGRAGGTALPVVVLSGPGGVGKTALALHAAHAARARFPHGQLHVALDGTGPRPADPAAVLAGFLRDLGVAGQDIPGAVAERARMYRARLAGKRILVVLDDAGSPAQVRPLLPGGPPAAVLVTSRRAMPALDGSRPGPLDALPPHQAAALLAEIIGADRAAADPAAVAEIVAACGGLPLAVRVAGARLQAQPGRPASWLARRLRDADQRLALLTAGDLDVRASLARSYHGCTWEQRHAFAIASLLPAGFPAQRLADLLGVPTGEAARLLDELTDAALARAVPAADPADPDRYELPGLLRDFARECLLTGEITDSAASVTAGPAGSRPISVG